MNVLKSWTSYHYFSWIETFLKGLKFWNEKRSWTLGTLPIPKHPWFHQRWQTVLFCQHSLIKRCSKVLLYVMARVERVLVMLAHCLKLRCCCRPQWLSSCLCSYYLFLLVSLCWTQQPLGGWSYRFTAVCSSVRPSVFYCLIACHWQVWAVRSVYREFSIPSDVC